MSICPNTPELSYLSRPNYSLLGEWKASSQNSFTSLAIFLLSAMLDSQVFSIISPLIFFKMDKLEAIATPSFFDDTNASCKVFQEEIDSLSLSILKKCYLMLDLSPKNDLGHFQP
jgi:hypothetical protein